MPKNLISFYELARVSENGIGGGSRKGEGRGYISWRPSWLFHGAMRWSGRSRWLS